MDETNSNPGPGEYVEPSEFGHYMARTKFNELQRNARLTCSSVGTNE